MVEIFTIHPKVVASCVLNDFLQVLVSNKTLPCNNIFANGFPDNFTEPPQLKEYKNEQQNLYMVHKKKGF